MASFSDYIVFLDESGDHSLTSINPEYPVFVLSFCVFSKRCYTHELAPAMRSLKFDTFGHDMVILHENDIRRRKGAFKGLSEKAEREFIERLSSLIDECQFKLIAVVIDKVRHKARYNAPLHPYHLALQLGLERLHNFLASKNVPEKAVTHVVCEARGAKEDEELRCAFDRVCNGENRNSTRYPFSIVIADKKSNSEGLQVADLTARPIGLSIIRPSQPNQAFEVLKAKFFMGQRGHTIHGNGLKVFP